MALTVNTIGTGIVVVLIGGCIAAFIKSVASANRVHAVISLLLLCAVLLIGLTLKGVR